MARDFRKVKAWERAHALTLQMYRATSSFPGDERFGLVSQMRRGDVKDVDRVDSHNQM